MKKTSGTVTAPRLIGAQLLIAAALLAAGGVAEAVAPLPQTRIDEVDREFPGRIEVLWVLPEQAHAELAGPLSFDGYGLGYFARSVRELEERFGLRSEERGSRGGKLHVKKAKKKAKGPRVEDLAGRRHPELPATLEDRPERRFGDLPILPEPFDRPFEKRGSGYGRGSGNGNGQGNGYGQGSGHPGGPWVTGEVREPSASALLMIGMLGLLVAVRTRKPH